MRKWLEFIEIEQKPKTKVYSVMSKCSNDSLGQIRWYSRWRHYCFFPITGYKTVHSDSCLNEISEFISKINEEHKTKNEKKFVEIETYARNLN